MCKKENYGPVIFPYEMTSQGAAKLCSLVNSQIYLIDDQTSVQMARSLMSQTKKGNHSVSTKASFTDRYTTHQLHFKNFLILISIEFLSKNINL